MHNVQALINLKIVLTCRVIPFSARKSTCSKLWRIQFLNNCTVGINNCIHWQQGGKTVKLHKQTAMKIKLNLKKKS